MSEMKKLSGFPCRIYDRQLLCFHPGFLQTEKIYFFVLYGKGSNEFSNFVSCDVASGLKEYDLLSFRPSFRYN